MPPPDYAAASPCPRDLSNYHVGWSVVANIFASFAYFFLGVWGLRFAAFPDGPTLLWIPGGLALGLTLIFGKRLLPAAFIGQFLVCAANDLFWPSASPPSITLGILAGTGALLQNWLGHWLLTKVTDFDFRMWRLSDAVSLIFVATPLAPTVGALLGTIGLCAAGYVPWTSFVPSLATWYVGNAIAILLVTPLLLTWSHWQTPTLRRVVEGFLLAFLVFATAFTAFGQQIPTQGAGFALAFLPIPLVVWGALRLGPSGSAALTALMCAVSCWATLDGRGPFANPSNYESLKILWSFVAVISGISLCLSASTYESIRAQSILKKNNDRYKTLVDGTGVIAWEFDPVRNKFTFVSGHAKALLGYPIKDWYQEDFFSRLLHPEDVQKAVSYCKSETLAGRDHELDYRMVGPDGRVVWIHDIVTVVNIGNNKCHLHGVMIDITERVQIQESIAAAERKFRALFEQSPHGVMIIDPATATIVESNGTLGAVLASPFNASLSALPLSELDPLDEPSSLLSRMLAMRPGASITSPAPSPTTSISVPPSNLAIEARIRRRDGKVIEAAIRVSFVSVNGKEFIQCILQDVTQDKLAAAALRESETRFRNMFEHHDSIMLLIDQESGAIVDANAAASAFYGYERSLLRTLNIAAINQGSLEAIRAAMHSAATGIGNRFEFTHQLKDGSLRDVEVHSSPVEFSGHTLLFSIIHDISERKQALAERDQLQARMAHTQKLHSLGVMAGGVAHDFNNLLVGILGNASLVARSLPVDSPARPTIAIIEQAAQRAADLTRQLLAYAGKGRLIVEAINLSDLAAELKDILASSLNNGAVIDLDLATNLPPVEVDATQVRQVVMNLLTNAADAMVTAGGSIRVSTGVMYADRDYLSLTYVPSDAPEGTFVFLEVSDTGKGMDQATLERIFDPFFTTKFTGRGLGLAAALGIMKGHHGAIKVESNPGHGTTIRILLPPTTKLITQQTIEAKPSAIPTNRGTHCILIVDDDPLVRQLACACLQSVGYTTIDAEDGASALELLKHNPLIAVVLLDLTMPGMNGPEIMWAMREAGLPTPVVLTSGYAEQEAVEALGEIGPSGFVQKPYTPDALIHEIDRVILTLTDKAKLS